MKVTRSITLMPVVAGNDIDTLMMMEWGYEFPRSCTPCSQAALTWRRQSTMEQPAAYYVDAAAGKIATGSVLFIYRPPCRRAYRIILKLSGPKKKRSFNFLSNKAIYNSFHLDAWDVFNMSDDTL